MPRPLRPVTARAGHALLAAALGVVLCACTATPSPEPTASAPSETAAASAAPTPTTPAAPALVPNGSAADNLPYFTAITEQVWAGPDPVSGRAYVDALVAGGFEKGAMQVTNDTTTLGNPAESIQFSVLFAGECLVGQAGPEIGEPVTVVLPAVEDAYCLIGHTRPIDW